MSNYLTRAAARAAPDNAAAVRPRLHSRYEGPAAPAPAAVEWETPAQEPAEHAPGPALLREREVHHHHHAVSPAPEVNLPHGSAESHGSNEPPVTHVIHETHTTRMTHETHLHPAPPAALPLLATTPVPVFPGPRPAAGASGFVAALPPLSPDHTPPAAPVPPSIGHRPSVIAQQSAAFSPAPSAAPATSAIGHRPSSMSPATAPLLESPRAALPQPAFTAPAAPEQRTVNITIGRLEIRAATPAPDRPRAPRSTGRGPLALDDFLRGKSRARPSAS